MRARRLVHRAVLLALTALAFAEGMSERAKQEHKARGWTVVENVPATLPDPKPAPAKKS